MSLSLGAGGNGGFGGGGGGVGSGLPPTPSGYGDVAAFIRTFEGKVASLLSLAARSVSTIATGEVADARRVVALFIRWLSEVWSRFPSQVPREILMARFAIKRKLEIIMKTPSEGLQEKRHRFFLGPEKNSARDLVQWLNALSDRPLEPPRPALPTLAPTPAPTSSTAARSTRPNSSTNRSADGVKPVPRDHPIWGVLGIMHGLGLRPGSKTQAFNPAYDEYKRSAKVLGHNGLAIGQWFPNQLSAMWYGGHGESNAGISYMRGPNGEPGPALSIIMAEKYSDIDVDRGDDIVHCGSNSLDNTSSNTPVGPPVRGNAALLVSKERQSPVRVFRKAKKGNNGSAYAPKVGLRYDGLYVVVGYSKATNDKGGIYHKFTLRRGDGQPSLDTLRNIPSRKKRRDYAKIDEGY
ncbi:YDG/SRA domain-containing protein [Colletotrichum tamarilloi]|uniref:YDG/SRA domain-containing protein n=1 Tax=Colletotrichum tamarilloi TaxID=1209934 RepID=A0ABQ9QU15_9PEZI|nr:YDG/SRA domain-containing protein [Colletotrichum tamarilloi]KAK1485146.1 YDG/SRA domain-containing protein [Colletotrichum tamarilloi]